jgi:EpsI family protein
MPGISIRVIVIGLAMLVASGLAVAMKPTQRMADMGPKVDLEVMIPKQFGDWRMDDSIVPVQISPDVQAALDKIYNQTLSRTYINNRGQRVMLSIAYGGDQSDTMQVHMPEGCYAAQGFAVMDRLTAVLQTRLGELPVSRLLAYKGPRNEPITYWIVIGEEVARSTWEMKRIKLRYAIRGMIPDGVLMRVSNITPDTNEGYALQQEFIEAIIVALPPEHRARFFGTAG